MISFYNAHEICRVLLWAHQITDESCCFFIHFSIESLVCSPFILQSEQHISLGGGVCIFPENLNINVLPCLLQLKPEAFCECQTEPAYFPARPKVELDGNEMGSSSLLLQFPSFVGSSRRSSNNVYCKQKQQKQMKPVPAAEPGDMSKRTSELHELVTINIWWVLKWDFYQTDTVSAAHWRWCHESAPAQWTTPSGKKKRVLHTILQ